MAEQHLVFSRAQDILSLDQYDTYPCLWWKRVRSAQWM